MLTATLENVLNRGLPRSERAQQLCAELAGRTVLLEIRDVGSLLLQSNGKTLKLSRVPAATAADTQICGGLFSLLSLTASRPEASIQRGDVAIRGDAELAQKFQELTRLLRPDFEEELSLVLGDVPAHQIGRLARTVSGWTRRAAWTTVRNVAEYLAHERRELVSRNEAEPFLRDIDTLREDVDRLGARIDSLSR